MSRLSPQDASFLIAETRETPMHVGGLHLYRPPEGADIQELFEQFVDVQAFRSPFNRKLKWPMGALGMPRWVEDEELDIDYHLRLSALPTPGRYRELFVLISRLHGILLDRSRPLWECHLIEGLESGQFALYTKMHHALIDGIGGMQLLQSALTEDPDERGLANPWAAQTAARQARRASKEPRSRRAAVNAAAELIQEQVGSMPQLARALTRTATSLRTPIDQRTALPFEAPKSILNGKISGARRFVAQSYPLERIKTVGKAFDATINDVVLAMSAGALRRYLLEHGELPDKPLVAMTPVSVRPAGREDLSNAVSALLANLGTHIEDPAERMRVIRASMADGKELLGAMSYSAIMLYTMLMSSAAMAPTLFGLAGRVAPGFNTVISNVPGPRKPLYWNGAELEGMYPVSIPFHGVAVNITVTSYVNSLDFGITACRRSVPHVQRLIDYLQEALEELEQAAGIGARKAAKRRKASSASK